MGKELQSNRELAKRNVVVKAQALMRSAMAVGDEDFALSAVEFIVLQLLDQADAKIDQLQKQLAEKEQELPY